jgi:hypothetical protein
MGLECRARSDDGIADSVHVLLIFGAGIRHCLRRALDVVLFGGAPEVVLVVALVVVLVALVAPMAVFIGDLG